MVWKKTASGEDEWDMVLLIAGNEVWGIVLFVKCMKKEDTPIRVIF